MPSTDKGARNAVRADPRHLICSSGGSRAILGGAGAILALEQAGFDDWETIGGISGGSVPTALKAGGHSAKTTLRLAIDIDFSSKLTRHGSIQRVLLAYFMQGRAEKTRPRHGVLSSEKLGAYIDTMVPEWPKGFWTMAVVGKNQILFTDKGVYEITPEGEVTVLSNKPAPMGLAVRATCAVPGVISAVPYKGRFLFDGALSADGGCPVIIPQNHFGAQPHNVVACDVGGDSSKASERLLKLWGLLCGGDCVPEPLKKELIEEDVALLIKPRLTNFRSLQFSLTRDQKWQAVMAGYVATVEQLKKAGLIKGEQLKEMTNICHAFKRIDLMCKFSSEGHLSRLTEDLLAEHGLY